MKRGKSTEQLADDPLWYRDAVIYELHVRAFQDADGNGIGDFQGLTTRLDYLQQLGVTAIWLLPFYPSPLRDDGYDIADYYAVHPFYGRLKDFELFLAEAHRRGLRVITELVINHTSDQHAWFQRARRSPAGSNHRDFYVWRPRPGGYPDARIIFKDFEHSNWAFDPVANAHYWHRFYAHQPDLNFDNPAVVKEVQKVLDFWFRLGVDGMRLDAVPYLFEREGTDCENLPETHAFLRDLRRHVDRKFRNRMLLAEANQWPEDAAAYFGAGDECHMNFHFPLMPRLFMALQMEDAHPILDILAQTPPIPDNSQWALFLRNHDELTLEMVTDEERDYMYRVYARDRQARINLGIRRRLAPLLGNNRRAIELLNGLLFALPGTPVIYYGDEIGMGDNIYLGDRNGVRTPMQWSSDRNAGFSPANPQRLYLPVTIDPEYHYETINVEAQAANPNSLLWWMRRAIAMRNRYQAFGRGRMEVLPVGNRKVFAFLRLYEEERILVVANLSRHVQFVALDLSAYTQYGVTELFGEAQLPPVGESPYPLTLGPHEFFWIALQAPVRPAVRTEQSLPALRTPGAWQELLSGDTRRKLERALVGHLPARRWFGGKSRRITDVQIEDAFALGPQRSWYLLVMQVSFHEGQPETYQMPVTFASGERGDEVLTATPYAVVARLTCGQNGTEESGVLFDAVHDPEFGRELLAAVRRRPSLRGGKRTLRAQRTRALAAALRDLEELPQPRLLSGEQSNTSMVFDERLILKLYRRLAEGVNPDLEIGRHLTEQRPFANTPAVAGWLEAESGDAPATFALIHTYVHNQGDFFRYSVDEANRFLERAATQAAPEAGLAAPDAGLCELAMQDSSPRGGEALGAYLELARLLGQRTAELHAALAADTESPDFAPEPFSPFYRRALFQSIRNLSLDVFARLRRRLGALDEDLRPQADALCGGEAAILEHLRVALQRRCHALRTRTHGDYHLGQVLYANGDFVIIDFEGEPARPIGERRIKRSPLRDVAGMVRSFHYAAYMALFALLRRTAPDAVAAQTLEAWARTWRVWSSVEFLRAYLEHARKQPFLAECSADEIATLLAIFRIEKAIYELGYELDNRPDWVRIPLLGLRQLQSEVLSS